MIPTLLDRYIIKRLVDYLIFGIVVFTLVLFFSDALLDFMKDLQHYGIPWDIALTLVGLQIPKIIAIVIPMSALLAALLVYSNMNNQFELIAMRMSGISLYRIAMPALLVGLVASMFTYVLNDYVVPTCNKYTRGLKTFAINQQNLPTIQENFTYKQFDDNQQLKRLLYISRFDKSRLGYSTVIDLTNPDTLQVIQARAGLWGRHAIELEEANVYTVSSSKKLLNTTQASRLELQHFIVPQVTVNEYKPSELSFLQLREWITAQKAQGEVFSPKVYVTLWEKLMTPLSSLPLVLMAIPLAISSPRRIHNLGFLAAVIILFLYYLIRHVSVQIGVHGFLPPVLAAALPLLIITTVAVVLFRQKNKIL